MTDRVELWRHPASSGRAVERVEVTVRRSGTGLEIRYRFAGALQDLELPPDALDPERLWEHTCAELFVAPSGGGRYLEWNFSPNGQSARFSFSEYRQRTKVEHEVAEVEVVRDADALLVVVGGLSTDDVIDARVGLTAISRDVDGSVSYWAAHHPTEHPDFHHRDGFVVDL